MTTRLRFGIHREIYFQSLKIKFIKITFNLSEKKNGERKTTFKALFHTALVSWQSSNVMHHLRPTLIKIKLIMTQTDQAEVIEHCCQLQRTYRKDFCTYFFVPWGWEFDVWRTHCGNNDHNPEREQRADRWNTIAVMYANHTTNISNHIC